MTDRASRFFAAFLIALGLLSASIPRNWFMDDAYITFRYAENLAQGRGLVFNPGERVFGLTTPLHALLLGGAVKLGVSAEIASRAIAGLSLAALILALVSLSRQVWGDPWPGLLAGCFLLANPVFLFNGISGMETHLFLALWTWAFLMETRGRMGAALLLAGVCLWCRLEGGVALAVIFLAGLLKAEHRGAWLRWMPGILLAVSYPVLARLYYGQFLPQSFLTKFGSAYEGLAGSRLILDQFKMAFLGQNSYTFFVETPFRVLTPFLLLGLILLLRAPASKWGPFFAGLALYALIYIASGKSLAHHFPWYFVPPLLALDLAAAEGVIFTLGLLRKAVAGLAESPGSFPTLSSVCRRRQGLFTRHRAGLLPMAAGLIWMMALLPALVRTSHNRTFQTDTRIRYYAVAGQWAKEVLPPGGMLATHEIGALACFSDRPVLDLWGLVSTERLPTAQAVAKYLPALVIERNPTSARDAIEKALPGVYRWYYWRRLWIGVRASLGITPALADFDRRYEEMPRWF